MTPERPFKAELAAFRKALRPPRVPGSRGADGLGNRNSADLQHLKTWERDWRAEEIWRKFSALNTNATPREFISRMLKMRREAKALLARISLSRKDREYWSAYYAQRAAGIFVKGCSLSETADRLDGLTAAMREAAAVFDLMNDTMVAESRHVGRQNKTQKRDDKTQRDHDWRVRRLCIVKLGDFWHEQCGRWCDPEVAALTEIAFPGVEISAEQVRNVRRSIKAAKQSKSRAGELRPEKVARLHH